MEHDNEVLYYAEGVVHMRICFPHGKADCRHCRFVRFLEPLGLFKCQLTEDLIERCDLDDRPKTCPVILNDEKF